MNDSLVIVAIPSEDDYVMKVSSEKIPHLTLLYLGESGEVDDLEGIMGFVEHAAELVEPFWMTVDHRGTLGEHEADVLFFEKGWDFKRINEFREGLKQYSGIKKAYAAADQHSGEWLPHLTLGYPETPAHELEDERRLHSVSFDRIAVWNGDFKGMEFRLKHEVRDYDMAMSEVAADETALQHYGVKGMRWGVRRGGAQASGGPGSTGGKVTVSRPGGGGSPATRGDLALRPTRAVTAVRSMPAARFESKQARLENKFPSKEPEYRVTVSKKGARQIETRGGHGKEPAPEAVSARVINQQRKASGLQSLSNQQLQDLAKRLQLEKQVADLTRQPESNVTKFIKSAFLNQKDRDKHIKNGRDLMGLAETTKTGARVVGKGKRVARKMAV